MNVGRSLKPLAVSERSGNSRLKVRFLPRSPSSRPSPSPVRKHSVKVAKSQKTFSPGDRFVIVLHSPVESLETGLPFGLQRKTPENCPAHLGARLSLVRFEGKNCRITPISRDFQSNPGELLRTPDCLVERAEIEPSARFCCGNPRQVRKLKIAKT